jgi:hypothetical protein
VELMAAANGDLLTSRQLIMYAVWQAVKQEFAGPLGTCCYLDFWEVGTAWSLLPIGRIARMYVLYGFPSLWHCARVGW